MAWAQYKRGMGTKVTTRDPPSAASKSPAWDETIYFGDYHRSVPLYRDLSSQYDPWDQEVEFEEPPVYQRNIRRTWRSLDREAYEEMMWQRANIPFPEPPRKGGKRGSPAAPKPAPAPAPSSFGGGSGGGRGPPDLTYFDESDSGSDSDSDSDYGSGGFGGGGHGWGGGHGGGGGHRGGGSSQDQRSKGFWGPVCLAVVAAVAFILLRI